MQRLIYTLLIIQFSFIPVFAGNELENSKIIKKKTLYIEFSPDDTELDPSSIKVRDEKTGLSATLNLQPQLNNSKTWFGYFQIYFALGENGTKFLEFSDLKNRKLYIITSPTKGIQSLTLFDNIDQWSKASETSLLSSKNEKASKISASAKATQSAPVLALSAAEVENIKIKEREKNQIREQSRLEMEEALALKKEALLKEQAALSAQEKRNKKEKAQKIADEASKLYQAGKYKDAVNLYSQSAELDPENEKYYYQYGVSLYKVDSYNKSLVVLSMAEGEKVNDLERDYYIALNHMKLKEYDKALKEFIEIRNTEDPTLSPPASFFAGNIEFQTEKYTNARKSLEYVLDKSSDPKMDKSAESLLEKIDRIENFIASNKEIFRYSFTLGSIYDQNILNVSTNNSATDVTAYRLNYGASLNYNIYRTMTTDFGFQTSLTDYYSVNRQFKGDATIQSADPFIGSADFHYKYQFEAGGRGFIYGITPTYSTILMAPTGGARKTVVNSRAISTDLIAAFRSDLISRIKLDYNSDLSLLTPDSDDDKQTSNRYGITYYQTKILNLKGTQSLTGDISYWANNAQGKNNTYTKTILGLTYGFPFYKESLGSFRVDYTKQNFNLASTPRIDNIWSATIASIKDLNKSLNLSLSCQYTSSASQSDLFNYNKFLVMATLTHTTSVLKK